MAFRGVSPTPKALTLSTELPALRSYVPISHSLTPKPGLHTDPTTYVYQNTPTRPHFRKLRKPSDSPKSKKLQFASIEDSLRNESL